jgi:hypothetical protein
MNSDEERAVIMPPALLGSDGRALIRCASHRDACRSSASGLRWLPSGSSRLSLAELDAVASEFGALDPRVDVHELLGFGSAPPPWWAEEDHWEHWMDWTKNY